MDNVISFAAARAARDHGTQMFDALPVTPVPCVGDWGYLYGEDGGLRCYGHVIKACVGEHCDRVIVQSADGAKHGGLARLWSPESGGSAA